MSHDMFRSVYGSFEKDEPKDDKHLSDGQGEPKDKTSKGSKAIAHSIHVHQDGSVSVEKGDDYGMGEEEHAGSMKSKMAPHGAKDDMSGAGM